MNQLMYAILATPDIERATAASILLDRPLEFVAEGPLTAACSAGTAASPVCEAPGVPQLLAFAHIVESLFAHVPVLPLRYGCWLDGEAEIRRLLAVQADTFRMCLQRVQGCVEMELSILPPPADSPTPSTAEASGGASAVVPSPPTGTIRTAAPLAGGAAYLRARQQRYADQDSRQQTFQRLALSIQNALTGLYVASVAEQHGPRQGGLWSLYFLVRRNQLERFRGAFRVLQDTLSEKLLLTGPWPPYNFVSGKTSGAPT